MDAKSSAGVPLSSPAAAQRCAEGAGLDSGAAAAAQSAMPSIALPATAPTADYFSTNAAAPAAPQLQSRISTSLTDVTSPTRHDPAQTFEVAVGSDVSQCHLVCECSSDLVTALGEILGEAPFGCKE
jgi:hypothetical protein